MCLFVIAASIALGFFAWRSEMSIRLAGYGLQLIGMIFAIRALTRIRAYFQQTLLRDLFFDWLKRFPRWKNAIIINATTAHLGIAGMKASVDDWSPDNPDQTVEKRLENLVKNLERLRNQQHQHAELVYELRNSHEQHKKNIAEQTKKMEDDIRAELESLHTSDFMTSVVGLVWLTVGITFSTMAPELYDWVH